MLYSPEQQISEILAMVTELKVVRPHPWMLEGRPLGEIINCPKLWERFKRDARLLATSLQIWIVGRVQD